MRKKEKYSILKFKKGQKFFSASILFSYLWVLLFPLSILYSQPVNVPNFNAPQLSNQNFNQYVDLANESHSIDAWNTIVNQGFGVLKGTWENLANQEIAALEANVNTQYASDPATAAYINKMIESQASQSEQAWLTQIETQVADDQNSFLLSLQNSNLPSNAVTDSNFQGSLNKGLQNFSDSLTSLQQNYQNQLASINQTDAQYQQNIQQLQNYENAVRSNIQTAVNQLASSLQNTALFYNTNADGSVNWSSMNQSGTDLQTLISNLDQGLQNGTSLSTLASQMTAYLQQQETQATQNSNYWTQQSLPHSLTNSNSAVGFADYQLNNFQDVVNYANSVRSANSAINAIMTYIDGGKNSQDATLLSYLYSTYGYDPTKTQIVGISRADFVGTSTGYNNNYTPFPVTLWHSGDGLSYSTSGLNAFDFSATGLWAFGVFLPVTAYFTEDKLTYSIDFQIKDLTAGANAQAWNGFASNLNSELGTWNTLSPSISNWEGQMSAYQAQYAAWHAQAVAYEAQLQTSYSDGVANLDTQKQSWLASLSSQTSTSSGETHRGDDDDESRHVQIQIPNISNISLPNSSAVLNADTTAPNVDTSSLNNVLTVFQQSLIGAGNVALESRLNEQAITTKQNAVNQIASSLGKNAVVDSYGNITYTTAIEDGHAKLKAGGDATNSSDYEATKTNQNVYIGAPSTIKIASGGNLFQNWDTNSVLTENRTNEDSFHKSYNTAIKTLNTQINSLNAQNAKNDLAFQAAAQSAASYASDVQSLAKAMLQGGTFESWAKGQIQDKVNAAMATAIANATGMSPDMASQLVSWFEKKQADKKAKAKARTQEITSGLVTVASIAASFIAGPEMMAVGQAALQAVQGYQNGGMEGALVGAASGAATGYARQFGV
ncbi:large structural domain protein, partial [Leptospira broomii serovar Hurstbridge str. 5399]